MCFIGVCIFERFFRLLYSVFWFISFHIVVLILFGYFGGSFLVEELLNSVSYKYSQLSNSDVPVISSIDKVYAPFLCACLLLSSGIGIRYQRYFQGYQNKSVTQSREHMPDMTCIYTLIGRNVHLFYKIQLREKFLHYHSIQSPCI